MTSIVPTPRRPRALLGAALGLAPALAACAATDPGPDLAAARVSLRAADSAYSALAASDGWSAAILAMLTEDGFLVLGPANPARGLDAVGAALAADTLLGNTTATWRAVQWDVSADGTRGYTYGYFDAVRPDSRAAPGKYSAYWRRSEDGGWKVVAYRRGLRPPGEVPPTPAGFGPPPHVPPADAGRRLDPPPLSPARLAALEDSVDANERAFSDLAQTDTGIGGAFAAFAAPDGANFGGGPGFVWGRDAIAAQFDGYPPDQGFTWHPDIVEVAPSGDLAFTTGPVYQLPGPDGVRPPPVGRYFSIWRRQPDGAWRYVIDG
jgi:ketosteroid isomerase-like protein